MAIIITNQSYTAGDRGALILSAVNRDTANPHPLDIDLLGETGTNQISVQIPQGDATNDQGHMILNFGMRPGDTMNLSTNVWATIDTDPSRGN